MNLEPMLSEFITAHPRCPKDPDLPAIRYALKEFMEEQAPSNFSKERWAASYDGAESDLLFLVSGHRLLFLDKLDFTTLVTPPVEPKPPVFMAAQPILDPFPPPKPIVPSSLSPEAKPVRQSRLWNAGGPAALAAQPRVCRSGARCADIARWPRNSGASKKSTGAARPVVN